MSLLQVDSHDHYIDVTTKYSSDSTAQIVAGVGRQGTFGIVTDGSSFFTTRDWGASGNLIEAETLIEGISLRLTALPGDIATLFQFQEADGTNQICIALLPDGTVQALRGDTTGSVIATSSVLLGISGENYVEAKASIDAAAGRVIVRLWNNANFFTDIIDFSGNTRNGGTGILRRIMHGLGIAAVWDDRYLCDDQGDAPTDLWGNKHVVASFPESAGFYTQWQPVPFVPNWENVDENPPDNNTSYNYAPSVTGDTDTFAMEDTDQSIEAVVVNLCVEQDVVGADAVSAVMRFDNLDAISQPIIPDVDDFLIRQFLFQTAPGNVPWSQTVFNNSQAGYTINAAATYWLLPYLSVYAEGAPVSLSGANVVQVLRVFIPYNVLVSRIAINVGTGSSGKLWGTGLYSEDMSTLILDSGPIAVSSSGIQGNDITAVEIPAGMYWYAWTCDSMTPTAGTAVISSQATTIRETGTAQYGHATNVSVAGQLPSSMGGFTSDAISSDGIPVTVIH